jgi:hypothetical protein
MSQAVSRAVWSSVVKTATSFLALTLLAPQAAFAQSGDGWHVSLAPLYLSAAKSDGQLTAGTYTVNPRANFALISGLRTFTFAPTLSFTRNQALQVVDTSRTSANLFAGFTYRPKLSEKLSFVSRVDIGGGNAKITWSAVAGVEYRFKPWGGLVVAYKGLGIDASQDATAETIGTGFDMTYYGPTFGLNLHWGKQ